MTFVVRALATPKCINIGIRQLRFYTSNEVGVRERLLSDVKAAMKNKDNITSTTLRSVLSEVYAADKVADRPVESSAIVKIIRLATLRRNESAAQFIKASRPDLAEKEQGEARLLSALLPPLISTDEIDRILSEAITAQAPIKGDPRKMLGQTLKAFYSKVDKSRVDPAVVNSRAKALWTKLSEGDGLSHNIPPLN